MTEAARCCGCGGRFADPDDADTHPYMLSSSGCWTAYNVVLAREYQDPALFARCHRLTVDAYALQHRGDAGDPRAVRSVWLHFVALDAVMTRGLSHDAARDRLSRAAAHPVPPLPAATPAFAVTLADVEAAGSDRHEEAVRRWAVAAHTAWAPLLTPLLPR